MKDAGGTKGDPYRLSAAGMAGFRAYGMPWSDFGRHPGQARPSRLGGLGYDFGISGNLDT
jgi:hypothetical protein